MEGSTEPHRGLSRRDLLRAGAAAGAGLAFGGADAAGAQQPLIHRTDFASLGDGGGWGSAWRCTGVANLRVAGGLGVLEAGSDVFPNDPRPVAFIVDGRVLDGTVRAVIPRTGSMAGVVMRRTGPRDYYAALFDAERSALAIVRRSGSGLVTLAERIVVVLAYPLTLEFAVSGSAPTSLRAVLTAGGLRSAVTATDGHAALQDRGDAGVLSRSRTFFPSEGPPILPALGNLHLLPYGVQEGEAFIESPAGQAVIGEIRRASTALFREITLTSPEAPRPSAPSVIAATSGLPRSRGARVHVATDLPARVSIEVSSSPSFRRAHRVASGRTAPFEAFTANLRGLPEGRHTYWRATVRRRGMSATGPVRRFRILPEARREPALVRLAVASCATQFGPLFDELRRAHPDVFVWQGDLNYPDTHGPLAQTMSGYAGIWRDFLANPRLAHVLDRTAFVAVRDDHDYARQDSNGTTIPLDPHGLAPWDALMGRGHGYRFSAGAADVWVLDQRRFKSDPAAPDDERKTLLGARQRRWLVRSLRRSDAPFKVICSPCTVFMPRNRRDGNWAAGFNTERDDLLAEIDRAVSGRVIFVTGDTHLTAVYDADGRFEARACPICIPVPNDITISDPLAAVTTRGERGVAYADERSHFAVLDVRGSRREAELELTLRREDGAAPYRKVFRHAPGA